MTDIENYEKLYSITEDGSIYSHKRRIFLKPQKNLKGYYWVGLYKNKIYKRFQVHRLVAQTFIKNKSNKSCVNHIDGNKSNNRIDNLEWCTISENNKHAYQTGLSSRKGEKHNRSKLTDKQAKFIYEYRIKTDSQLAKIFGVDRTIINKIRNKRIWKHIHK